MEKFGNNLRQLRYHYNLSQIDLARILNVTRSTICMYETNRRIPSVYILLELSKRFNISIDSLINSDYTNTPTLKSYFNLKENNDNNNKSISFNDLLIKYGYLKTNEKLSNKELNIIMNFLVNNKEFIKNQK